MAQALHNAVLVVRIDHWVMENDPSQVGRISENPRFCLKSRDPLDMDSMISQGKMSKLMISQGKIVFKHNFVYKLWHGRIVRMNKTLGMHKLYVKFHDHFFFQIFIFSFFFFKMSQHFQKKSFTKKFCKSNFLNFYFF